MSEIFIFKDNTIVDGGDTDYVKGGFIFTQKLLQHQHIPTREIESSLAAGVHSTCSLTHEVKLGLEVKF